jgi:hypothetical protein
MHQHLQEDSLCQGRPNVAGLLKTKAAPINLAKETQIWRSVLGPSPHEQSLWGVDGLWALLTIDVFTSVRVHLPSSTRKAP